MNKVDEKVAWLTRFLERVSQQEGDMSIRRLQTLLEVYKRRPETSIPDILKGTTMSASHLTKTLQSWAHRNQYKKKGPGYIRISPDPMNLKTRIIEITGQGHRAVHQLITEENDQ